jgi:hypothetical protein
MREAFASDALVFPLRLGRFDFPVYFSPTGLLVGSVAAGMFAEELKIPDRKFDSKRAPAADGG